MTDIERPYVPEFLPPSNRKTSLVDDLSDLFQLLWEQDDEDFRALATSTDLEDAVEGSVTIDKILLARLVKQAAGDGTRVGSAKVGDITRVMHHAAKRFGVSRVEIAARKAEYMALTGGAR